MADEPEDDVSGDEEDYSGDFAAVVVDSGSGLMKAGFAGDDAPRAVFPSIIGRPRKNAVKTSKQDIFAGDEALCYKTTINYPIQHGIVQNWDDMRHLWRHTFDNELRIESSENMILLSEPPMNSKANREQMAEILFEEFNCPAIFIANQSVLSLYASARTTGMVVDCGDGVTHFAPIYDGYVQEHCAVRFDVAGQNITNYLQDLLKQRGYDMKTTLEKELVRDLKEQICFVSLDYDKDMQAENLAADYKLPDGSTITIENERCHCTEILFQPHNLLDIDRGGIHELCFESMQGTDIDLRTSMRENIVLCGGTTLLPGFSERLKKELKKLLPPAANVSISQNEATEKRYSVWIGGSILASVPKFDDMVLTKEDYEEEGRSAVHNRFSSIQ